MLNLIDKGTLLGAQQKECRFGPSVQCEKVLSVKIVYQNVFWANSYQSNFINTSRINSIYRYCKSYDNL